MTEKKTTAKTATKKPAGGIHERLLAIMADVHGLEEKEYNKHSNFNYAGHGAFSKMLRPLFVKYSVGVMWNQDGDIELIATTQGKDPYLVKRTTILTLLCVEDPTQRLEFAWTQINPLSGGKGIGSTASYAKKYILRDLFMIDTGSADDLDAMVPNADKEDPPWRGPHGGRQDYPPKEALPTGYEELMEIVRREWHDTGGISEAQAKRLYTLAHLHQIDNVKSPKWEKEDLKFLLKVELGLESSTALPKGKPYDAVVQIVSVCDPRTVLPQEGDDDGMFSA